MTSFSREQQIVFNNFINGQNVFMTGQAGTGKTFLIRHIKNYYGIQNKNVQVCALTGCAALLLECNATTVHSWANIGLGTKPINSIINEILENKFKKKNWLKTKILIVDEVSMMSKKLFELLDKLGKAVRNNDKPFGGIQLLFSGDFYQLPPVGDNLDVDTSKFCFEHPEWNNTFDCQIQLKTCFRQKDTIYIEILNQLREGKITRAALDILNSRCIPCKDSKIKPTKLLPKKLEVNKINTSELDKLEGEEHVYNMILPSSSHSIHSNEQKEYDYEQNSLKNSLMVDDKIKLKKGAQVMCVINKKNEDNFDQEMQLVNGSRGVVTDFTPSGLPIVEFINGYVITMDYHIWESENIKNVIVKQIPLILAWAVTIHKSQGTTLDFAEINIGHGIFECGQSYVALSRVKNLDGLYLTEFDPRKIKIHTKVKNFYKSLQEKNKEDNDKLKIENNDTIEDKKKMFVIKKKKSGEGLQFKLKSK